MRLAEHVVPVARPRVARVGPSGPPLERPPHPRLLVVGADGMLRDMERARLVEVLRPGDLLVANDAATLPASLRGVHEPSGAEIEVRLVGRPSLAPDDVRRFTALGFGPGDHRTVTEDRLPPPPLRAGDGLWLGPLRGRIRRLLDHPRLFELDFAGSTDEIWEGLARHGRPIQYEHQPEPLALWDVWTRFAGAPVAFEPPSAGFALDWRLLGRLAERDIGFATLTLAAGVSSTGDPALDARLPLDEPYVLPGVTMAGIERAQARGGRVIAVGTTVTRALEHAASRATGLAAGHGVATQRIGPGSELRIVDAILTGLHEPGDSHYELLRAFARDRTLTWMTTTARRFGYRAHEFGDSVLLLRG